jgi:two-component system nitrogen regulation sensor histidine kinase GlnL
VRRRLDSSARKKKSPAVETAAPADRWSRIIDSLEEGVIDIDTEGRILSMNQAAEQLTACGIGAARGRQQADVFADSPWVSELLGAAARSAGGSVSAEGSIRSLWRKAIPVRATASPILDAEARPAGAALILHDLTIERSLEVDVQRAQSLAQLGVLVAGLAHEIRNPLGGIRGAVQLLASEVGPHPTAGEYVDLVIREVDRLSKLLEQLLELRPRGAFDPQPVNIHRVIDHVIALVEAATRESKTKILRFFDPSLPEVQGDPDALTQLVLNLVQNALQAVATLPAVTSREVRLTTRVETDYHLAPPSRARGRGRGRGRMLRVEIEDNGPGIPPEVQSKLFSPFLTTKPKGTGLGLAICQRIATDHGGTIRCESTPGRTLFRVTLPAWDDAAARKPSRP